MNAETDPYDGDGYEFSVRAQSERFLVHVTRDALAALGAGDHASQLKIFSANAGCLCDIAHRLRSSTASERIVITAADIYSSGLHHRGERGVRSSTP